MEEYGSLDSEKKGTGMGAQERKARPTGDAEDEERKKVEAALMQSEERNTGAVTWDVYKRYLRFAGGLTWAPVILVLLILNEATNGNNLHPLPRPFSNIHIFTRQWEEVFSLDFGLRVVLKAFRKASIWLYMVASVRLNFLIYLNWYLLMI